MADHLPLHLTSKGQAELADSTNAAINPVKLTKLALGTGSGPGTLADAQPRTALRTQAAVSALAGSALPATGRIAASADFPALAAGSADQEIREIGILAKVGDDGVEFLLAYRSVPAADAALTRLTDIGPLAVTGVVDISSSPAATTVNVSASVGALSPPATRAVAGVNRHGTDTEMDNLSETTSPAGVVPDLRGLARVLSLVAATSIAASQTLTWNKPFSKALVLLAGGSGGGGGATFNKSYPALPTAGGDGGNTTLTVGADTYTASGGAGGAPGNKSVGVQCVSRSRHGMGGGGAGADNVSQSDTAAFPCGLNGGLGQVVVVEISGLQPNTELVFTIGSGGSAGTSVYPDTDPNDTEATAGSAGWAKIIPLPSTA